MKNDVNQKTLRMPCFINEPMSRHSLPSRYCVLFILLCTFYICFLFKKITFHPHGCHKLISPPRSRQLHLVLLLLFDFTFFTSASWQHFISATGIEVWYRIARLHTTTELIGGFRPRKVFNSRNLWAAFALSLSLHRLLCPWRLPQIIRDCFRAGAAVRGIRRSKYISNGELKAGCRFAPRGQIAG